MKKLRAFVITVPLLILLAKGKAHAILPLSGMTRGQYESRPAEGLIPRSIPTPPKGEAASEKNNAAGVHKRRHGWRHDRRHARRKSRGYSDAARARDNLKKIKRYYRRQTHTGLVVTSFGRTEPQQALAIRGLIRRHGVKYVRKLYRNGPAINEILAAYLQNRRHPRKAQRAMSQVISDQVARGVYVSKHLRGLAADIRRHGKGAARLSALRTAAHKVGATVLVEIECYHLNLV